MPIKLSRLFTIALLAVLAGCATQQKPVATSGPQIAADTSRTIDLTNPANDMWDRIRRGYAIPNAYLAGVSYPFQLGGFFMDTYVAYKYNAFKETSHDVQWTLIWTGNFFNNKLTLCGFADLWTENSNPVDAASDKKAILLSEPQIWYNANENLSLGGEVEISSNFAGRNKAFVCPTLAVKWNF